MHHDREPSRYCANLEEHAHLFCEGCGSVTDLPLRSRSRLDDSWDLPAGMVVSRREVSFQGLCPDCAARAAAKADAPAPAEPRLLSQNQVMSSLVIQNLHATVAGQEILRGLTLEVEKGKVHAIMGPNGSGKSTLSKIIAGHPDYVVTGGDILMDGESILGLEPDERARKGVFLAFQYPMEIPGVSNANFLRAALQARLPEGEELEATEFYAELYQKMDPLEIPRNFTARAVNEGFSGGEKKRNEILQMAMLQPQYAILDETDSGLISMR